MTAMDDYYRRERLRRVTEMESARENTRAARFRRLYEDLEAALNDDPGVLSDDEAYALSRAYDAVASLRKTW